MEAIVVDFTLIIAGVAIAAVALGASIGAADGGPNPSWSLPVFLAGVGIAILGVGLVAAKFIALIASIWR